MLKKILQVTFLLLVISFCLVYALLYVSFNLQDFNNPVNHYLRKDVIAHHWLKKAFRLRQVGDARFEFSQAEPYREIKIIIYRQNGEKLHDETMEKVIEQMEKVVNKPKGIRIARQDLNAQVNGSTSDQDIKKLINEHAPNNQNTAETIALNIFLLKRYSLVSTYTGLAQGDNNIFLFMDRIKEISDQENSTAKMEISTILHEFAHQLGAGHVEDETCLLSPYVENISQGYPNIFKTEYCQIDLDAIKRATQLP